MCAFGTDVVEGRHHVTGQLTLNAKVPLIYTGSPLRIDCAKPNVVALTGWDQVKGEASRSLML